MKGLKRILGLMLLALSGFGSDVIAQSSLVGDLPPGYMKRLSGFGSNFNGDNIPLSEAIFSYPSQMNVDGAGNIYVLDDGNYRIRKINASTGIVTTVVGNGEEGTAGNDGLATEAQLPRFVKFTVDQSGNIYLTNYAEHEIRKVDAVSGQMSTYLGTGVSGYSADGTHYSEAQINSPRAIHIDEEGNIYISEGYRIRKVDAVSGELSTVAGTGVSETSVRERSGDGGLAVNAGIGYVKSLDTDGQGNVYFLDYAFSAVENWSDYRIRKVDASTDIVTTVVGGGEPDIIGDYGLATEVSIWRVNDFTLAANGDIYLAETNTLKDKKSTIRKVDAETGFISAIVGQDPDNFGDTFAKKKNEYAYGLVFDGQGNLFVSGGGSIEVITPFLEQEVTFQDPADIVYGQSLDLTASSSAEALSVKFKSSDEDILSFDEQGNAKVLGAGEVRIVAYAENDSFDIDFVAHYVVISKAPLTITADDITKPYGLPVEFTLSFDGLQYTDNADSLNELPQITCAATETSAIGTTHDIVLSGGVSDSYDLSLVNGTLTVSRGAIKVMADPQTITYGQAVPELTYTYEGIASSEDPVEILGESPVIQTTVSSIPAAGTYEILINGTTVTTDNYEVTYVNNELTVNKAVLDVKPESVSREVGEANGTLTYTYSGFIEGESAADLIAEPQISTLADESSKSGWYSIALEGGQADNYEFNYLTGYLWVNPEPGYVATFAGGGSNGPIQGEVHATETSFTSPSGLSFSPSGEALYFYDYKVNTIRKLDLSTGMLENVLGNGVNEFSPDGALSENLSVSVASRLSIDVDGNLYFYEKYRIRKIDFQSGQLITILGNGTEGTSPDGTLATEAQLSGVQAMTIDKQGNIYFSNYSDQIRMLEAASNRLVTIAGTGVAGFSGDGGLATEAQLNRVVDIDLDEVGNIYLIDFYNDRVRRIDADDQTISTVAGGGTNYVPNFTYGTLATETKLGSLRSVKVHPNGDVYFIDNDRRQVLRLDVDTGVLSMAAGAENTGTSNVDGYLTETRFVNPDELNFGPDGDMYFVDKYGSNHKIKRIGVRAEHTVDFPVLSSKIYGEPAFELQATTNAAEVEMRFISSNPEVISVEGNMATIHQPGTVKLIAFGENLFNDYAASGQELTIGKGQLIVKGNTLERFYGQDNPELTVSAEGLAANDDLSVLGDGLQLSTAAQQTSIPASYAIEVSGPLSIDNYDVTYQEGTLNILKAPLTVAVNDYEITYGDALPEFEYTLEGFAFDHTADLLSTVPQIGITKADYPDAGSYAIVLKEPVTSEFYELALSEAALNVAKAKLTVQAENISRLYGDPNPEFTLTYSGFVFDQDESVVTQAPQVSTTANTLSPVGDYAISLNGGTADNYEMLYKEGILTVNKAPLDVIAEDKSKNLRASNPEFTLRFDGFKNGEDESVLLSMPQASCEASISSPDGEYEISVSGGSAENYRFSYVSGTLTVLYVLGNDDPELAQVKVFPNPVINKLKVQLKKASLLKLLNMEGKILYELQSTARDVEIDVQKLQAGVYFLIVDDGESVKRFKLIK